MVKDGGLGIKVEVLLVMHEWLGRRRGGVVMRSCSADHFVLILVYPEMFCTGGGIEDMVGNMVFVAGLACDHCLGLSHIVLVIFTAEIWSRSE